MRRSAAALALARRRIDERSPGGGLGRVCATLLDIGERTRERLDWVERPHLWLRAATWLMAALLALGAAVAAWALIQAVRATGMDGPLSAEDHDAGERPAYRLTSNRMLSTTCRYDSDRLALYALQE